MTVIRVDGVKNTIKTLGYIDPELRKTFNANVKQILAPIVNDAKSRYASIEFPSGTVRSWAPGDRIVFPLTQQSAARKVGVKTSAGRRNASTIAVVQRDAGASVFEFAQKGSLGQAFTRKNGPPARVMWKAATSQTEQVTSQLKNYIDQVTEQLNRELML